MAESNEIKVTFSGGETPTGGPGDSGRPVGSSQDTGPVQPRDMRENFDLDEAFGVSTSALPPVRHTDWGPPGEAEREAKKEEEERAAAIQEEHDRRQRVQNGLDTQRRQEEAAQKREDDKAKKEEERAKAKEEKELNEELKRQYREQQQEEKRAKAAEEEEKERRNRVQSGLAKQKIAEEKKADQEAKNADAEQRAKMQQAGQAVQQIAGANSTSGKLAGLTNLASSGMLGSEAAALAGGPLGGIVMAAGALQDAASGMVRDTFAGIREGIQLAGNTASNVFGNDYGQAAGDMAEGAAKGIEKMGVSGVIAAEALRTATAALGTFNQVVDSAAKRGRELEGYSAGIAGAGAQADVRKLTRDIAEAQRNEGSYSSIIDSQSKLEDTTRAVMDPIKDAILGVLAEVLEPIADVAVEAKPLFKAAAQIVAFFISAEANMALLPFKMIAGIVEFAFSKIPDWMKAKDDDLPDLLGELDRAVENLRNGSAARQSPANDPDRTNRMKKPHAFGG